ncbi:hypothetical protein BaRGS_00024286, partial [Batillaria attramentaria]
HTPKSPAPAANTSSDLSAFKRLVTDEERQIFLELMDAFNSAMSKANLTYFLYGGTLIGSWRHHGWIPWDDDGDVGVPYNQQSRILEALSRLAPAFLHVFRPKYAIKFYSQKSSHKTTMKWKWPFIDVCFYLENDTHVWDPDPNFPEYNFPREEVFPLRMRPFEGRMLPVPGRTEAFLKRTYKLDQCMLGHYDHRVERGRRKDERGLPVGCAELEKHFPFVHRVSLGASGCNETLVRNGTVISWYVDEDLQC